MAMLTLAQPQSGHSQNQRVEGLPACEGMGRPSHLIERSQPECNLTAVRLAAGGPTLELPRCVSQS